MTAIEDERGPDPRRMAELLCGYCLDVTTGAQVLVRSTALAAPLLLEIQREVLTRGAWPLLRTELPGELEGFYTHALDEQIDGHPAVAMLEARAIDRRLAIQAPANTRALAGVDPQRLARATKARAEIFEASDARWCSTLWPTDALAQQAGMSLHDYAAFVCRALLLDRPDPVQAWRELSVRQAQLIERLAGAREVHILAEGTDLRLRVDERTWINSDGRRNMPSGEVFTGPIEDSAEGRISFNVPTGPAGVTVSGVELELRGGEVVRARAREGEDYLHRMLASDDGARRLGELGIGTNDSIDRPTGTVLLDEKIGGTVHVALGRSYTETGGRNESALHWDLICDLRGGGTLSADGELVQSDGRFVDLAA